MSEEEIGDLMDIAELITENEKLEQEIERLHSIIKEAREYIEKASYLQGNKILEEIELLKILDKVEEWERYDKRTITKQFR